MTMRFSVSSLDCGEYQSTILPLHGPPGTTVYLKSNIVTPGVVWQIDCICHIPPGTFNCPGICLTSSLQFPSQHLPSASALLFSYLPNHKDCRNHGPGSNSCPLRSLGLGRYNTPMSNCLKTSLCQAELLCHPGSEHFFCFIILFLIEVWGHI